MKKTNKKKNNDNQKLIITIIAVALIIAIIGGATFAYWSWQTSNAQRTNIAVEVKGATFTIVGNNIENTGMYPTADCDGQAAVKGEVATVTIVNETESPMTAALKIRATLTRSHGTLNTENKAYLKWAIVELNSANATVANDACKNGAIATGNFSTATSNTDIDTGITFTATELATTTKYYKLYIWLDSTYSYTNTGSTVSDPMQDLKISVRWSPASTLIQGS